MARYFSSRDFNQDTGGAKRAAALEPVFITDRGEPSHVLLSIDEYRRLTGAGRKNIAELLWMPGVENIELEIAPREEWTLRPVDLD